MQHDDNLSRERGINTSRSSLTKTISKLIGGVTLMGLDVLEAHIRDLTRNEQHGRTKASKLFMSPDTPNGVSHITKEHGVSGNAHTAGWAGNHHTNKRPKRGSQLHRVTVTNRIRLNNTSRAVHAMKQRAGKVVPSPAKPNTDSRPAEPGRRIRASRRGGRAIR